LHDRAAAGTADRTLCGLAMAGALVAPRVAPRVKRRTAGGRGDTLGGPALGLARCSRGGAARPDAVCRDRPFRQLAAGHLCAAAGRKRTDRARPYRTAAMISKAQSSQVPLVA